MIYNVMIHNAMIFNMMNFNEMNSPVILDYVHLLLIKKTMGSTTRDGLIWIRLRQPRVRRA